LIAKGAMKRKLSLALIYANAALALAFYFDGLYGGEPIKSPLGLIHAAIAGAVLLVIACVLSIFNLRLGIVCGIPAIVASWPYFLISLVHIPWGITLFSLLPYALWGDAFAALLALAAASIYCVVRLRSLWSSKSNGGAGGYGRSVCRATPL
jgi:hypothetical protein